MNFRQNFSHKKFSFAISEKNFSRDCSLHTQRLTQRKPLSWTFCSTLIYMPVSRVGGPCPYMVSPPPVPVQCTGSSSTSTVSSASTTTTTTRGCIIHIYIYIHVCYRVKTMFQIQSTNICGSRFDLRMPFSQSYYTRPHGLMHERLMGSWRIQQSDGEILRWTWKKHDINKVHKYLYIYI